MTSGTDTRLLQANIGNHADLVDAFGTIASQILRKLAFWDEYYQRNPSEIWRTDDNGQNWIYNSAADWGSLLNIDPRTAQRHIGWLEAIGVIKSSFEFNVRRVFQSKWYTIDYDRYNAYMDQWEAHDRPRRGVRATQAWLKFKNFIQSFFAKFSAVTPTASCRTPYDTLPYQQSLPQSSSPISPAPQAAQGDEMIDPKEKAKMAAARFGGQVPDQVNTQARGTEERKRWSFGDESLPAFYGMLYEAVGKEHIGRQSLTPSLRAMAEEEFTDKEGTVWPSLVSEYERAPMAMKDYVKARVKYMLDQHIRVSLKVVFNFLRGYKTSAYGWVAFAAQRGIEVKPISSVRPDKNPEMMQAAPIVPAEELVALYINPAWQIAYAGQQDNFIREHMAEDRSRDEVLMIAKALGEKTYTWVKKYLDGLS